MERTLGQHLTLRPLSYLLNYSERGKLPRILHPCKVINKHRQAQTNDKERREYNMQYADRKRHTKPSNIDVGDRVPVRQDKQTIKFSQTPYTVINRKRSEVTAHSEKKRLTLQKNSKAVTV